MAGTHVYKASFRMEGGNNRTFAFWGRILVPAAVFLAFLEGFFARFFWWILVVKASGSSKMQQKINFPLCRGSGGKIKFLIEKKAGKNIGSTCLLYMGA